MPREVTPVVTFPGRGRRGRAALIALEGARPAELALARAHALRFDAEPLRIAVDGGLAAFRAARVGLDLFVGDLDSTPTRPRAVPSTIYPADKDFSDFSGALTEATRAGVRVAAIAGLLGGRFDHEWANVLELAAAAPRYRGLIAPTARGLIVVTASMARVAARRGRGVSVFALGGAARVTLRGTRWTLSRRRVEPGSLGLSNLALGEVALDVHDGVAALIFPKGR